MKYLFLIFISSIAFTGFSKFFDPIVIGLDIGKQNHFSEFNSLSTPFLAIKKDISDSLKQRRHGVYIEPWLFGRIVTFGYSYDFFKRDKFRIAASIGAGVKLRFSNPNTGFYFPFGIESMYNLKKNIFVSFGVHNRFYLNYWAYFSEEDKDCFGLWLCPPDTDAFVLMPFIGGGLEYSRVTISPRIYFSFFAWWDKVYPLPTLRIKLRI